MNGEHFRAFLWLRWRLRINQMKRAGTLNAILFAIFGVGAVVLAVGLFVASLVVGLLVLGEVPAVVLLLVWDGLVVAFLFSWMIGLIHDLQRSEVLSLDRFLHLPVSLSSAFLINYLSSFFGLTLLMFLPPMVGLALALVLTRGPVLLLQFPLLAAFLLVVTALTYQFQGWLATLMTNKRRRRTIIVVVTMVFVLVCQAPNLINILRPWDTKRPDEAVAWRTEQQTQLQRALAERKITPTQYVQRLDALGRDYEARVARRQQHAWQEVQRVSRLVNLIVPAGWMPLGAMGLAEGDVGPALLGTLGLGLLGTASLWRAYRTTLRLYTGEFTSGTGPPAAPAAPAAPGKPSSNLLERRLPWLPEQATAIALASFRSLLRAPEAKMMLLTPPLLLVIFGSILLSNRTDIPPGARPLLAFGATAMILFSTVQFIGNQFGFDRSGFRVFVLCPAPRRAILLGKNLAFAPLALGLTLAVIVALEFFYPMRVDRFLATLPQALSMYLLFCLLANWLSILAPMPISAGTMKPTNFKAVTLLLQLAFFFLFPIALLPALLPLGAEQLVEAVSGVEGMPIYLALSLAECAGVVCLYRLVLGWQGQVLLAQEQKILMVVASRAE